VSDPYDRAEQEKRRAQEAIQEKPKKIVDLHKSMKETIAETGEYIAEKKLPSADHTKKRSKKPADLHQSIEGLKEEASETLVEVQTSVEVGEKTLQAGQDSVYATPEYREYVQSGQELKQAMETAPSTLSYITKAPEGYYYRGQDVQEHNQKVREYNRQVREYKRQLQNAYNEYRAGLITYDAYEVKRKSYEVQLKLYEAEMKRTAPEREAFGDYLRGIGPPEPTEEQRRRMDAGLPLTGIPGPANVPPPGSMGAKIQPIVQEGFERTLGLMEMPFKAATEPIRDIAAGLKLKSIEAAMEGEPWAGFGYYAAGTALRVVGAGIDVATFEYRPGLWVDVARTLTGLAVNPSARTAFVKEVAGDPFGFTAEMAGGAYLGRYAVGKVQSLLGPKKTVTTRTDPMAYRKIQKTIRTTQQPPVYKTGPAYKIKTETMKIGSGFERAQAFIPEEVEVVSGFVSTTGEGSVATPFSKGSYPVAAYDKTLWGQTGAGLRQLSQAEAITIPKSMVETQKIWRLMYERVWKPGIETPIYQPPMPTVTHIVPGDYLSRTVTSLAFTPRTSPSLIGLLGLGSQLKTIQPVIPAEIQRRAPAQITRPEPIQRPIQKPVQIPTQIPVQIPIQTPVQAPIQVQIPTLIQAQIQKPILALDLPQLTIPDFPSPEKLIPGIPDMPLPQTPRKPKPLPPLRTGQRKKPPRRRGKRSPMEYETRQYRMPAPPHPGKMKKLPSLEIPKIKKMRRRLPKL